MKEGPDVVEDIEIADQRTQQRSGRMCDDFQQFRKGVDRRSQGRQLTGQGLSQTDPGGQPLEIGEGGETVPHFGRRPGIIDQFGDRPVTLLDLLEIDTGPHEPVAQQPGAHPGFRVIQRRQ